MNKKEIDFVVSIIDNIPLLKVANGVEKIATGITKIKTQLKIEYCKAIFSDFWDSPELINPALIQIPIKNTKNIKNNFTS